MATRISALDREPLRVGEGRMGPTAICRRHVEDRAVGAFTPRLLLGAGDLGEEVAIATATSAGP